MKVYPNVTRLVLGLSFLSSPSVSTEAFPNQPNHHRAFCPRSSTSSSTSSSSLSSSVVEVETTPVPGMRPGTSGLRKKVEVWQGVADGDKNYVENFIQSLIDTATASNGGDTLDT